LSSRTIIPAFSLCVRGLAQPRTAGKPFAVP
jgi:hypothetical protein